MKYDNILKLLDCHIHKYQKILDKQEPFSQSELIAKCNSKIKKLNIIKRQIEVIDFAEGLDEAQLKKFLKTFGGNPKYTEFIGEILLPEDDEQ